MGESGGAGVLNDLLDTLDLRLQQRVQGGHVDAISAVLSGETRRTAITSLHDAPAVDAFRQALSDGLIRVDTANRLLRLINEIIVRFVP